MTISSVVFQTLANLLPREALRKFNTSKGNAEFMKAMRQLLSMYYERFNVIIDDAAARIRQTPTHFKDKVTKQVTHVRTFREVADDILHKSILTFLNGFNTARGYVLIHDAPGEAPVSKRHTAKERAKRVYGDRPPSQEELDATDFVLDEPMPWTMQQIFGSLAGRRKFLHALYRVLISREFRSLIPEGKFVVFDGAILEDGSWAVARITRDEVGFCDVPLVREGDNATMRWVHHLATEGHMKRFSYLVTSNDGDVLLALLANHFRLESEALRGTTLTFHTKRKGKEFAKLLDDEVDEEARGAAASFEQMVEGKVTEGRVDFFFDIRAMASIIQTTHPSDPFAVESFLVAVLVACDKHDFIWHRFLCTNVGVANVLPAHIVWGPLYGPLVTDRRVEGPLDHGKAYYEFDLRALFSLIKMIYYAKHYVEQQKRVSKANFARKSTNDFLRRIGREDLKDDLVAQPVDFKADHGGSGMHDLDPKLIAKADHTHLQAYKEENRKTTPTRNAFKNTFNTAPLDNYGPEDVFWKRLAAIGATQIAYMIQYMSNSPYGVDESGIEVDPVSRRPYAAYTEDGYTCRPLVFYEDVLSTAQLRGEEPLLFRYPHYDEPAEESQAAASSSTSSSGSPTSKRPAEDWEYTDEMAGAGCSGTPTVGSKKRRKAFHAESPTDCDGEIHVITGSGDEIGDVDAFLDEIDELLGEG